jgi:phenylalanyl-tRNA synthetase beta chain
VDTRLVVLESASFNPISIRRTARDLGIKTEASRRFERGLDPALTVSSAARATQLMVELANGRPADGVIDLYPQPEAPRQITLHLGEVAGLLGRPYERQEVGRALQSLDFEVQSDGEALQVTVPSHRRDVERKADLIEEVARITGYEAIPEAIFEGRIPEPKLDRGRLLEEGAREALVAAGCQEVITYSLVAPDDAARLNLPSLGSEALIRVSNPMSVEQSALRQTLLGSLLETVRSNLRHRERVWCFELARVYLPPLDPLPREPRRLALAMAGQRQPQNWALPAGAADFFDLKGVVEQVLTALGVQGVVYRPARHPTLQPGQSAELLTGPPGELRPLGVLGRLDPRLAERFDLEGRAVLLAEMDFDALCELASDAPGPGEGSTTLPRFPGLQMDLALVVDESVTYEQVLSELRQAGGELLVEARLFDVYQGAPIPEGHKSLAFALTFRAPDRTLTDQDIAQVVASIELRLAERLGARVRRG